MCIKTWRLLFLIAALLTGCANTQATSVFVSPISLPMSSPPFLSPQPETVASPTPFHRPGPAFISPTTPLQPGRPAATPVPGTEPAVARAVADLAARLGIDASTIEVVRVSAEEFPAQNLGCPPPGSKEPPVQPAFIMGREIVLAVGERQYVYHTHGGVVVFCGAR